MVAGSPWGAEPVRQAPMWSWVRLVAEAELLAAPEIPEQTDTRPGAEEATRVVEEDVLLRPRLVSKPVSPELQTGPVGVEQFSSLGQKS